MSSRWTDVLVEHSAPWILQSSSDARISEGIRCTSYWMRTGLWDWTCTYVQRHDAYRKSTACTWQRQSVVASRLLYCSVLGTSLRWYNAFQEKKDVLILFEHTIHSSVNSPPLSTDVKLLLWNFAKTLPDAQQSYSAASQPYCEVEFIRTINILPVTFCNR